MDLETVNTVARELMENRKAHLNREKGAIYYHGQRAAKIALALKEKLFPGMGGDGVLTVAAWFHDAGKGIEPHEKYGEAITREALKDILTAGELDEVCMLVSLHDARKPQDNAYPDLLKVLQDADLLDHFGTMEPWMLIQHQAAHESSIEDTADYAEKVWAEHLKKHYSWLNFDLSKEIYNEKGTFITEFYRRFSVEGRGGIYTWPSDR